MSEARVNIGDLRRFSAQLKAYNEKLKSSRGELLSALEQLGQDWDDEQRRKFEEGLRQASQAMDRLSERIDSTQLPYLHKKIQAGERYLNH